MKKSNYSTSHLLMLAALALLLLTPVFRSLATPPPVLHWIRTPYNAAITCNTADNNQKFLAWLSYPIPGSDVVCDPVRMFNNYCHLKVTSPAPIAGNYFASWAVFGPPAFCMIGNLQLATSASGPECCDQLTGFIPGNIAVIDRGTCDMKQKILNAKNAGAIGVIICNNAPGMVEIIRDNPDIPDPAIPAIMISDFDGNVLKTALASGPVNVTLYRDFFDMNCPGMPDKPINFFATDACGGNIMMAAVFSITPNLAPDWAVQPENYHMVCEAESVMGSLHYWLKKPVAIGPCGMASVTNDFRSLRGNFPLPAMKSFVVTDGNFGLQTYDITGDVQYVTDGVNITSDGCEDLLGFTPGKIALIDRGTCSFVTKVRHAQQMGAIGVIICNNSAGELPRMANDGTGSDITIPVLMISQADGIILKNAAQQGILNMAMQCKGIDYDCPGEQVIQVNFTATDPCGNFSNKSADFIYSKNVPPVWDYPPADVSITCKFSSNQNKLSDWLHSFSATGNCGAASVTNDFQSLRVSTSTASDKYLMNTGAAFGLAAFNQIGMAEIAKDAYNTLCGYPLVGFTPGNIAVIDRGTYTFVLKVKNAQDAGAVGVIICNNVDSDPILMGGSDESITIPVLMISKSDGEMLKSLIISGLTQIDMQKKLFDLACGPFGEMPVNFTARDVCGNFVEQAATFKLVENQPPAFTNAPADVLMSCNTPTNRSEFFAWLQSPTASGVCEPVTVSNNYCDVTISKPVNLSKVMFSSWASFGPSWFNINGIPELAHDISNSLCCGPLVGFTPGRIAVIDRGTCTFKTKARNAQAAGAAGVIICDYEGGSLFIMGDDGSLPDIEIPVEFISYSDGVALKAAMAASELTLNQYKTFYEAPCNSEIKVTFAAIDACGNYKYQDASFIVGNSPPAWINEPQDHTVSCATSPGFYDWTNTFSATGTCGIPVVTNDYSILSILYPPLLERRLVNGWASGFGPQSFDVTGYVQVANPILACGPLSGFTPGKIAVIDRGTCTFTSKVKAAQDAGAIGVIIVNNVDGFPILMGGTDPTITIPVQMISKADGENLKSSGSNMKLRMRRVPSTFDCASETSMPVTFRATDGCGNFTEKTVEFIPEHTFTISKSANKPSDYEPATFEYKVQMQNTSEHMLTLDGIDYQANRTFMFMLPPGGLSTFIYPMTYETPGSYDNLVMVVAKDESDNILAEKYASTNVQVLPLYSVERWSDETSLPEPGTFTMHAKVTNLSNMDLELMMFDSDFGFLAQVPILGPGNSIIISYPVTYTDAGTHTGTVSVEAVRPDLKVVTKWASSSVTVTDVLPSAVLQKFVTPETSCYQGFTQLNWLLVYKNTSLEDVTVTVDDDQEYRYFPFTHVLAPGETYTWNYLTDHTRLPGDPEKVISNTATLDVSDNEGNHVFYSATAIATLMAIPKINEAVLDASEGTVGPPWDYPVKGNYTSGFEICLDRDVPFYYLHIAALGSNYPLMNGYMAGFRINTDNLPAGFAQYWADKGVNSAAEWPSWQWYMYRVITGFYPMFYIKFDGNIYHLIDGFQFEMNDTEEPLRINGDYPAGDYVFEGFVYNQYGCSSDKVIVNLTVKGNSKIIKQPESIVSCIGETATFSVQAEGAVTGYQWYKDGIPIDGATGSTLSITPVKITDAGNYTVLVLGECTNNLSDIARLGVKEVIVDPATQQYSDPVSFTATIHNGAFFADTYKQVSFIIETQIMGTVPLEISGDDLTASLLNVPLLEPIPGNGVMEPDPKTVFAKFRDADLNGLGCVATAKLIITPEDALLAYDGVELQATASTTATSTQVQLIAVIKDMDDTYPGDIRNACVTFKIYAEPGGTLLKTVKLPVNRLVRPGDISTGIVSYLYDVDLGASDYKSFTIRMFAGCYYTGEASATLTVYKPVGDFITGGGHINTNDSYGLRSGEPGTNTNFGFHVKFNKKNTNLVGGMNIIYRRMVGSVLNEFQIKSNSMSTLGVNITDPLNKTGVFTTKANLTNLTTGNSIEGNLQLYVTLTDRGEPGKDNDGIGFTLWRLNSKGKPSILLYSSSWNGLKTNETLLAGGNLVVHSGFSIRSEENPVVVLEKVQPNFSVYPNPFFESVNFFLNWDTDEQALLEIYNAQGACIAVPFKGIIRAGEPYDIIYRTADLPVGIMTYRLTIGSKVKNGKLVHVK